MQVPTGARGEAGDEGVIRAVEVTVQSAALISSVWAPLT